MKFICLFILLFPPALNAQVLYSNNTYKYQCNIPKKWVEIPKGEIQNLSIKVGNGIKYMEGFYPTRENLSPEWGYPYILTEFKEAKIDPAQYQEIADVILKSFGTEQAKIEEIISENYGDLVSKINIGQGYYDKSTQRIILRYQLNLSDGRVIYGISTMFLCPRGLLAIHFYDQRKKFDKSVKKVLLKFLPGVKIESL
jgi:hypothetical protein